MLADRVMCAVPNPGPVDVGSTITLGAAPSGYHRFLTAFGGGKPAYFVLSDGADRTITGIWTVNASVPETATITEILGNDRTGDTSGETFAGDCVAWCEVPAPEVVGRRRDNVLLGKVSITKANPMLSLDKLAVGQASLVEHRVNGILRFATGHDQFGNWVLNRHDASGVFLDQPISVVPGSGAMVVAPGFSIGGVAPPALPNNGTGVGRWQVWAYIANTAAVVPNGGTWAYFFVLVATSGIISSPRAGVAAGGATLEGPVAGAAWTGFGWRIA